VIRTLPAYLTRELLKVTALALVAFTLVMTVFAIMEPLRREGLATMQVASLIGYTLPVMLSLTLPIAALFAATIVYGRFSQDNELLACRASGISTLGLLVPALALGAAVTVVSLVLSNFIAPRMIALGEVAVKANVESIARRQLRTRGYVNPGPYVVHAAELGPDGRTLLGIVAADTSNPKDVQFMAASRALAEFRTVDGETYLVPKLFDPVATSSHSRFLLQEASMDFPAIPLPSLAREDPSWYDWPTLLATLRQPVRVARIRNELARIRKAMVRDMFARDLAETVAAGRAYDKLSDGTDTYEVRAARAELAGGESVVLEGPAGAEGPGGVEVTIRRGGRVVQKLAARRGRVRAVWSPVTNATFATIRLEEILVTAFGSTFGEEPRRRDAWQVGQLPLPAEIAAFEDTPLEEIYRRPQEYTRAEAILERIRALEDHQIRSFLDKIVAELHVRTAYSLSCLLLVALGAALGLIFRGGHLVSAFALAMVPAALVIVMLMMGKEMIRNPRVGGMYGVAAIWGGIAALLAANVVIYARLARK